MFGAEYLLLRWVMRHVICIGLRLGGENFFIVGVLVDHIEIGGRMLGFIERLRLIVAF